MKIDEFSVQVSVVTKMGGGGENKLPSAAIIYKSNKSIPK